MFLQIISFLLDVAAGLITAACLLRLYMQTQHIAFSNPIGQLVFALSDWLVLPLRRVVPASGRWDLSSLLGALLAQLAQYLLLALLLGIGAALMAAPLLAVFGLLRVAITGLMGLLIVYAVLSWMQARSPVAEVVQRLAEPVLRPVRRIVPLVGGIDLSPLLALVALQVLLIVLAHLQAAVVGARWAAVF